VSIAYSKWSEARCSRSTRLVPGPSARERGRSAAALVPRPYILQIFVSAAWLRLISKCLEHAPLSSKVSAWRKLSGDAKIGQHKEGSVADPAVGHLRFREKCRRLGSGKTHLSRWLSTGLRRFCPSGTVWLVRDDSPARKRGMRNAPRKY